MSVMMIEAPVEVQDFPYSADSFFETWWQHLAPKFDITHVRGQMAIHRLSRFKGLISLREMRIAGWNNAWSQDLTPERVSEFLQLAEETSWDFFRMTWDENRRGAQAFELLQHAGYKIRQIPLRPTYVCQVNGGWEAYLESLSRNGRKDMRRKMRRSEGFNPEINTVRGVHRVRSFMEALFAYHIPYWKEKDGFSYFSDPREREFAICWAEKMEESGRLVMEQTLFNKEVVNLTLAVQYGDTRYQMLTINTGLYSEYIPGLVRTQLAIQKAPERGIRYFNLGTGIYPYKRLITNCQINRHEAVVFNPRSLRGKLYTKWLNRRLAELNTVDETE